MGTQGSGRKRIANRERLSAEDDTLNLIAREAEARLAAKRAARAEAREIRMKELERQQKEVSDEDDWTSVGSRGSARANGFDELSCGSGPSKQSSRVEERLEKDFTEKGSRAASSLSAATLASLGGTSSRRGSGETTTSIDTEGSIREIKDSLMEVEEKYKKAMVSNAQLDNEKANLMYQVDTLREDLLELEEQLAEMHRGHEEKTKELERQKHAYSILQCQFEEMKETLKEREEMLTAHGLMTNGEAEHVGSEGSAQRETTQTRPQAEAQQQSSSDSPLGESHGLQMRNEILKAVEQRGDMQNTGTDELMEETGNREMLMDNVEEKDKTENCEELTETDTPTMTVRDNGNADQIECTAANLDDAEQSACDTQNTGGKEVSEGINCAPGSEEGMHSYGCREGNESESDPRVNGNQLQEKANQTFNDIETGADYQMIVEQTQEIVQNVVEKAVEIFQQQMSGHQLQEKSQDMDETIHAGIGSVQLKGENLTSAQERPAESYQAEEKELARMVVQETEHEQAVMGDIELHSTAQESEICPIGLQGDVIKSGEAGQLLVIQSDQNDQSKLSGEGINEMDGAEKDRGRDQERKRQPIAGGFTVSEELEEIEEMAENVEVGNGLLKGAAMQELKENEEIACHLRGERGPLIRDEVNHAHILNEDQDWRDDVTVKERTEICQQDGEGKDLELGKEQLANEARLNPAAKPGDGARQLLQQRKVEDSLEHDCLQKIILNEEKKGAETEIEINAGEFEGEVKRSRENEDKAGELGEDEEKHKGLNAGEIKGHGMDESENCVQESVIECQGTDEGTDKESWTCGILYDGESWEIGEVSSHESERALKGSKVGVDKDNGSEKDQGKEENDSIIPVDDLYETKGSKEDNIKSQVEYEAKWEIQQEKFEMEVSRDSNSQFKIKEDGSEFQHPIPNRFSGPEEEGDVVKGPMEGIDEVRGEVKSCGEEGDEVKCSKGEERDEVKSLREEDEEVIDEEGDEVKRLREEGNEVIGKEGDEVKSLREEHNVVINPRNEEGDEVKSPKEDSKAEDEEEDEIKNSREEKNVRSEEEDEIKSTREKDNEVKDDEGDEVSSPRSEVQDVVRNSREEGEGIKGPRGEDRLSGEEGNMVIDSNVSEVKGPTEEMDKVKDPREEGGRARSKEGDMSIGPKDEDTGEVKGRILADDESIREDGYRVKGLRGEEEGEIKVPRGEEEGEVKEGDMIKSPREVGDEVRGPRDAEVNESKSPKESDEIMSEMSYEVKGPREKGGEVVEPRDKEGEEVKSSREVEDDVKSPRGEENNDFKDPKDKEEDKVKSGQKSEEQHGTNVLGSIQGKENEMCAVEESEEAKLTDLAVKEKLGEIMVEETECYLKGQVHESCKTNQMQSKSFEEICEGKPESVHKVTDNKIEQEMVREEEIGVTDESAAQENLQVRDEKETGQILDIGSRNKMQGDNAQTSEGVVSGSEENDGRTRSELNEGQEELAQGVQQDPAMGRVALEDVANQRVQDSDKLYPAKGERESSGTNQEQKQQDSEINETRIEDITVTQSSMEEQEIRDKDEDAEEGDQFEWNEEMNDMLQDGIQDDKEAPKSEEERGETSVESETEPRSIVSAGSSENLKPSTHCNMDAAYDEQKCQRRNSSSRQSNYRGNQQQGESPRGTCSISGAEGNMKETEEEMGLPETAKDSKRKSKSKDECSLS